jgi:hypothetical protein
MDLVSGQNYLSGGVEISTEDGSLIVQITSDTANEWYLNKANVYALSERIGKLAPGQFRFKADPTELASSITFQIPLEELTAVCGDSLSDE